MKRRLSRWLESLALPLFLFPFLHDCRFSDDRGWERGRRLSEEHGCGAMPSLDGLPAAFDAFMQARRARLERSGGTRQGWEILWFFSKYNAATSWSLLAHTVAYCAFRFLYLVTFDQYMHLLNVELDNVSFSLNKEDLWWVTALFCVATVATNLALYYTTFAFWRAGVKMREQVVWLTNNQVLRASQFDLNNHSSTGELVAMVGADARQFEYAVCLWKLLVVPLDVITVVFLLWRNLNHSPAAVAITMSPAILLLAVQPWMNKLFSRGLRKAAGLRSARINIARDGLVNYVATKLYGAQQVLLERAQAERTKEDAALRAGFLSYGVLQGVQLWMPPLITQIAAVLSFTNYDALTTTTVFVVLGYAKLVTCDALYSVNYSMAMMSSMLLSSSKFCRLMLKTTPSSGAACAEVAPAPAGTRLGKAGDADEGSSKASDSPKATRQAAPLGAAESSLGKSSPPAAAAFSLRDFEVWWPKAEAPAVRVPQFCVQPGQLVAVFGGVGSGKSTLLLGLLGELGRGAGAASEPAPLAGTPVAFAPQTPTILQDTIKANIQFGLEEDGERLRAAVHAAGFDADVARFERGLETRVAEKGSSLSGGQRIRLGQARCAYAALSGRVGAVLLDDPLAGVDPEKAKLIFQRLIARGGALEGLTRLVAVSDAALLPHFDAVLDLSLGAGAKTAAPAPPQDNASVEATAEEEEGAAEPGLLAPMGPEEPGPQGAGLYDDDEEEEEEGEDVAAMDPFLMPSRMLKRTRAIRVQMKKGVVIRVEGRSWQEGDNEAAASVDAGEVDRSSSPRQWIMLVRAMGWRTSPVVASGLALTAACLLTWQLTTQDWLDAYAAGREYKALEITSFIFGLGLATVIGTASVLLQTAALIRGSTRNLRAAMQGAFNAPYTFFQANPSSRILSRLADDQRRVDEQLNKAFLGCVTIISMTFVSLAMTVISLPYMILAIIPALALLQVLRIKFVGAFKLLRHEESSAGARVAVASTETLEGAAVARAFRQQGLLLGRLRGVISEHVVWDDGLYLVEAWLLFVCNVIFYCPLSVVACLLASGLLSGDPTSSEEASLVSNVFQIASLIYPLSATMSSVEAQLTAMQRVVELSRLEPEETAVRRMPADAGKRKNLWGIARRASLSALSGSAGKPWPSEGEIRFKDTTAAYTWGADPAVSRVHLDIPPGTSCVLMGHSGCGKSTLLAALTGLIPVLSGDIAIDGRSALTEPLEKLRSGMAGVPQEPALYRGTVRFNLDLLGTHGDAQLWEALNMVAPALAEAVRELGGLDAELDPQKPVISRGQMQLLCLARAILRDAPILLLDEYNASVDAETDALMEDFVGRFTAGREGLTRRRRTLVQVSHKATGMRSRDRIVVLDAGQVVEQGSPGELLVRPDSRFAAMLQTLERGGGEA